MVGCPWNYWTVLHSVEDEYQADHSRVQLGITIVSLGETMLAVGSTSREIWVVFWRKTRLAYQEMLVKTTQFWEAVCDRQQGLLDITMQFLGQVQMEGVAKVPVNHQPQQWNVTFNTTCSSKQTYSLYTMEKPRLLTILYKPSLRNAQKMLGSQNTIL